MTEYRRAGLDPASSGVLCRPPGDALFDWIPAYAGMTVLAFAGMPVLAFAGMPVLAFAA